MLHAVVRRDERQNNMNDNESIVIALGIAGATISVIAICITYYNCKLDRLKNKELEVALQNGYEQKYDTDQTQSSNYQWVKSKSA